MGLNFVKPGSNMYQFINATFNVIKGLCPYDCSYCYMKRWGIKQGIPRLDDKEFRCDLGAGNFIFVGSSIDQFSPYIPAGWVLRVLEFCSRFDNDYLFQSKNPKMMFKYLSAFPIKTSLCTTIETNRYYPKFMGQAPPPEDRVESIVDYVTVEPIMKFDLLPLVAMIRAINPKQVNIGADMFFSQRSALPEPNRREIQEFVEALQSFTKVEKKSNLRRLIYG